MLSVVHGLQSFRSCSGKCECSESVFRYYFLQSIVQLQSLITGVHRVYPAVFYILKQTIAVELYGLKKNLFVYMS